MIPIRFPSSDYFVIITFQSFRNRSLKISINHHKSMCFMCFMCFYPVKSLKSPRNLASSGRIKWFCPELAASALEMPRLLAARINSLPPERRGTTTWNHDVPRGEPQAYGVYVRSGGFQYVSRFRCVSVCRERLWAKDDNSIDLLEIG